MPDRGLNRQNEPSDEAARIWRALEMTHERMSRMESEHEQRQSELPRLMADAMKAAFVEVMSDPTRQATFWQGGVNHIRSTWTSEVGRSVWGVVWAVGRVALVLLIVLGTFGPGGFKALWATYWGGGPK